MENQEMINKLNSLVKLDIDAVHAYDQAIQKIDLMEVRTRLEEFKSDHQRHIQDLSSKISGLGGTPPEYKRDFKGYLLQGFTALVSITGNEGALKAMQSNEKLTNKNYDDALSWDFSPDVKDLIRKNREDERRHLQYIEQCINMKVWEKAA